MLQPTAIMLANSDSEFDRWLIWLILLSTALGLLIKTATVLWPKVVRWSKEKTSRNWPSVSGVIDIVAVAKEVESAGRGGAVITYMALLTYSLPPSLNRSTLVPRLRKQRRGCSRRL